MDERCICGHPYSEHVDGRCTGIWVNPVDVGDCLCTAFATWLHLELSSSP